MELARWLGDYSAGSLSTRMLKPVPLVVVVVVVYHYLYLLLSDAISSFIAWPVISHPI